MRWFAVVRPYGPTVYIEAETYRVDDGVLVFQGTYSPPASGIGQWWHPMIACLGKGGWGMVWEVSAEAVRQWTKDGSKPLIRQPDRIHLDLDGNEYADPPPLPAERAEG